MTRMTPLLERNEQFARTYTPEALGVPTAQLLVVTCLDHRVDPAIVLGLEPSRTLRSAAAEADPEGEYVEGAAESLPFADESFDLVVAYNSLVL